MVVVVFRYQSDMRACLKKRLGPVPTGGNMADMAIMRYHYHGDLMGFLMGKNGISR